MQEHRRQLKGRVALVATLGGMHAGHEAHLIRARQIADHVVGSLFLNPTQFSPSEDLATYPCDRAADLEIFERNGAEVVFAPSEPEMYPPGDSFRLDPGPLATVLEGKSRPGHFVGVATVVARLFNVIRPDVATLGEKDAQQLRVIEKMNRDMLFGVEIERIPTVREADGLACSSRNAFLSKEERASVPAIHQALLNGLALWRTSDADADAIRQCALQRIGQERLLEPDYVSVAEDSTLAEIEGPVPPGALLSTAVRTGTTRLIDNISLR